MDPEGTERRLVAILFTDMVGSTAATARSVEVGLVLRDQHRHLVRSQVDLHRGRFIEAPGDESLSTFESAVDAVQCALAIQAALEAEAGFRVRIGIHLGETTFRGNEVFGDGVNVAARVRALAPAGEIYVSGALADALRGQPNLATSPRGEHRQRGVERPVSVFALSGTVVSRGVGSGARGRQRRRAVALTRAGALISLALVLVALPLVGLTYLLATGRFSSLPSTDGASAVAPEPMAVVVLPFAYRGSNAFAFLGEGLVNLLSIKIDGAGGLRRVDPNAVLSFVGRGVPEPTSPSAGRRVAAQFGAGRFILGSVLEVAGRLHLEASLYSASGRPELVTSASVEGAPQHLSELVDELAAQLLTSVETGPAGRIVRIAAVTTDSFPALKAYLTGEAQFRAVQFSPSLDSFRRAVDLDPEFALARFRLAYAMLWQADDPRLYLKGLPILRAAAEDSARLPEREQLVIRAFLAQTEGRAGESERLYRSAVSRYPDDFEAWYGLGETLYHYNPYRGRLAGEARQPLTRAVELDPGNATPRLHLLQLAVAEGDLAEAREHLDQIVEIEADASWVNGLGLVVATATGDRTAQQAARLRIDRSAPWSAVQAALDLARLLGDLDAASDLLREVIVENGRWPLVSLELRRILSHWQAAAGRWSGARREVDTLAGVDEGAALEVRALLASAPFSPATRSELEEIRTALVEWDAPPTLAYDTGDDPWLPSMRGMHALTRVYLLGLVGARLGDAAEIERRAAELDSMEGPPRCSGAGARLARSLHARLAQGRGEVETALLHLSEASFLECGLIVLELQMVPLFMGPHDRFLRAEILEMRGELEEALRWYAGVGQGYLDAVDMTYVAPSLRRRARILEELGRTEEALAHYQKFVGLWRDADPELRPQVAEAEERIAELTAALASSSGP